MDQQVMEYKCPCCGAGLKFGNTTQNMICDYCDNEFELETVKAYSVSAEQPNTVEFNIADSSAEWTAEDSVGILNFVCPSCGGEIMTDENTAATFCPYCENPTILTGRVAGGLKPDAVIPFKTNKEDAKAAFLKLCKGKPLLPKFFTERQRIEKISGVYVPFWLYDCNCSLNGQYKATRVRTWSDAKYDYTKTDHYLLTRASSAQFTKIPMDASVKMDNALMESIEPFDYSQIVDFDTAYLSGYLADKYDVESKDGQERVRQRIDQSMDDLLQSSFIGYTTVLPSSKQLKVDHGSAKYVLLPVWMLHTRYEDKTYTFAMNGQSGKMTGTFPISKGRAAAWFAGVMAGVSLVAGIIAGFI